MTFYNTVLNCVMVVCLVENQKLKKGWQRRKYIVKYTEKEEWFSLFLIKRNISIVRFEVNDYFCTNVTNYVGLHELRATQLFIRILHKRWFRWLPKTKQIGHLNSCIKRAASNKGFEKSVWGCEQYSSEACCYEWESKLVEGVGGRGNSFIYYACWRKYPVSSYAC